MVGGKKKSKSTKSCLYSLRTRTIRKAWIGCLMTGMERTQNQITPFVVLGSLSSSTILILTFPILLILVLLHCLHLSFPPSYALLSSILYPEQHNCATSGFKATLTSKQMPIQFTVNSMMGLGNNSVFKLQTEVFIVPTGVFTKAWRDLRSQMWWISENILNKQKRTADKGGILAWGVGEGLESLHCQNLACQEIEIEQKASDPDGSFGTDLAQGRERWRALVNTSYIKWGECLD